MTPANAPTDPSWGWYTEQPPTPELLAGRDHHAPWWLEDGRPVGYVTEAPGLFWRARLTESVDGAVRRALRDHYRVPAEAIRNVHPIQITPPEPTP